MGDLAVVAEVRIGPHSLQPFENARDCKFASHRNNGAWEGARTQCFAGPDNRFVRRSVEQFVPQRSYDLQNSIFLEIPIVLSVIQEELIGKRVDAYVLLLRIFLKCFVSGFANPQRSGDRPFLC